MTTVKNILSVDATSDIINNWAVSDKSDFVLIDTKVNGENREAVYQRVGSVDLLDYPMTVRVGYYPKVSNGVRTTNISLKVSTFVQTGEDDGASTTYHSWDPITCTIAFSGPGPSCAIDALETGGGFLALLMNAVSWLAPMSGTDPNKVLSASAIDLLKFGVVNTLNGLAD